MKIKIFGSRVEERHDWHVVVVVETNRGDVWVEAGVEESERGTAEAAGSDHGLVSVWPYGDSLSMWCPDAMRRDPKAALSAVWDAAEKAYQE